MNVRSSRSHTIFRMVCPWLVGSSAPVITHWISCNFILCVQVIESKGKDTNSSGDSSSVDAIRVSVLVCTLLFLLKNCI